MNVMFKNWKSKALTLSVPTYFLMLIYRGMAFLPPLEKVIKKLYSQARIRTCLIWFKDKDETHYSIVIYWLQKGNDVLWT